MALDYPTYLRLPEMLDLQHEQSSPAEHDELLFIVIHQAYELWFKLVLHELDKACRDLSANNLYGAIATFQRVRTIMKTLVGQLDILETMTPMSFTSFRDRLDTSSGFQSTQFRELEFLLGYKRRNVLHYYTEGTPAHERMMQRLTQPSIVDHFYEFLAANGVTIPAAIRDKPADASNEPNEDVQDGLYELYMNRPDLAILFELMTDFDEGLQEWRYRHVKVVERTIGSKQGTGGSPGMEFLKKSLFMSVFADLWQIRHRL
ncbi:MAG: tryptophan 2,3-dioxygenase family protein [Planctomycetota bacterium]